MCSRHGPITLLHLLMHTSGVIASSDLAPASGYDVLALADTETGSVPGEHRHYSNVGYRAVGVAPGAVTGVPYGVLVQRRVLDRLGLGDSVPTMTPGIRTRVPPGYVPSLDDRPWRPEHGLVPASWVESAEADGCWCCTVEELGGLRAGALARGRDTALPPGLRGHEDALGAGRRLCLPVLPRVLRECEVGRAASICARARLGVSAVAMHIRAVDA